MFRLSLFALFITLVGLFLTLFFVYLTRIVKGVFSRFVAKSAQLANEASEQQQKWKKQWREREQRKKLPEIIQKAYIKYERLQKQVDNLPGQWKQQLLPLLNECEQILFRVSSSPEKVDHIRAFFNQSLDALSQLVEKLETDHAFMSDTQTDKVRQNITLIKADLLHHRKKLDKLKRFDFDVVMDVIKARLKQ